MSVIDDGRARHIGRIGPMAAYSASRIVSISKTPSGRVAVAVVVHTSVMRIVRSPLVRAP